MKGSNCKGIFKKFFCIMGHFSNEKKQALRARRSVVVSTAGKGDNHHVLLCPMISVDPVSLNLPKDFIM
jgi:hypothetical protein